MPGTWNAAGVTLAAPRRARRRTGCSFFEPDLQQHDFMDAGLPCRRRGSPTRGRPLKRFPQTPARRGQMTYDTFSYLIVS